MLAVTPCTAEAQETQQAAGPDGAEEAEESEHGNMLGVFAGGITRTERGDSGPALGLSYSRGVWRKWSIGIKVENAAGSVERDWLILAGFVFEVVDRVDLGFGIGPEWVEKAELEHGEPVVVNEIEPLVRFTIGYAFRLNPRLSVAPEFNVDLGSQVSLVYGLVLAYGF